MESRYASLRFVSCGRLVAGMVEEGESVRSYGCRVSAGWLCGNAHGCLG